MATEFFTPLHPLGPRGKFQRGWFRTVDALPASRGKAVRYWDKAGTEGRGDYTAGCLMLKIDHLFYVADVVRGRWSDRQRESVIAKCATRDREWFGHVDIWVEQEPGSSGIDSAKAK